LCVCVHQMPFVCQHCAAGCNRVPQGATGCRRVQKGAKGAAECQGCRRVPRVPSGDTDLLICC
jgi:hypothetical protein